MIAKKVYYVCAKSYNFDVGGNRIQIKSFKGRKHNHYTKQPCDVTPQKIFHKCLKNMHTACVFYSLTSVKNTRAEMRMIGKKQYKTKKHE